MSESQAENATKPGREVFRRKWTDQDRLSALAVLASCGGNLEQASRETGVPPRTLAFWRDRPASGQTRAALPIRQELMAQAFERLIWRLLRQSKGKMKEAKLPAVLNGVAVLFDRLKTLRDGSQSGAVNAAATGGLDLSKLSSDELRDLHRLIGKAGGPAGARGGPGSCAPTALQSSDSAEGDGCGAVPGGGVVVVAACDVLGDEPAGGAGVPAAAGPSGGPDLSGSQKS